ncbi:ABC transporter ATP-binding protein [Azospirillum sp. ST 5-10]|uniref:ABC transporter ATP-binding protein n=1 Tax=unclassified Azospirillum TaxID=2630922 RepID=UPI003F49CA9A
MDMTTPFVDPAADAEDAAAPPDPIVVEGLGKRFGSVAALEDVTVRVGRGAFVAIMGPSGSGKTTLLNILSCLDTPSTGRYRLDGVDVASLTPAEQTVVRRERIGLVFQQFHLIPYLNALENVMLAQHYHSMADRDEAMAALERVGLGPRWHHRPAQLSGGEQQRLCIARSLINDPALILADEPTGNLDRANETRVMDLFRDLHREGRTIVLVTHNPELGAMTDRIVWLRHGRVVPEGETP